MAPHGYRYRDRLRRRRSTRRLARRCSTRSAPPRPRPALRDPRLGRPPRHRRRRPPRPEDHQRRPQGDARRRSAAFAPYQRPQEGHDLRLGPHAARPPRLRPGARPRRPPGAPRAGWSSPAPARGSWPPASRAPGASNSFGVNIRLPFEQAPNPYIAGDPKLISMKYFFTRKLMLVKESHGFVSLPGGFGTLDETFELLTLVQTGKASPAPIVLLDEPGGTFWPGLDRYLARPRRPNGYIHADDLVALHRHRRRRRRRRRAADVRPQLPLHPLGPRPPRRPPARRPHGRAARRHQPRLRRPVHQRHASRPPTRSPRRSSATCSTCPGSCSPWTRRATPGSGR